MTTYYVHPSGTVTAANKANAIGPTSDPSACMSWAEARTVTYSSGDIVILAAGAYTDVTSWSPTANMTIKGESAASLAEVTAAGGQAYCLRMISGRAGIVLENISAAGGSVSCFHNEATTTTQIKNCKVRSGTRGIYLSGVSSLLVEDFECIGTSSFGIDGYEGSDGSRGSCGSNITIRRATMLGNRGVSTGDISGIFLDKGSNVVLQDIYAENYTGSGLRLRGNAGLVMRNITATKIGVPQSTTDNNDGVLFGATLDGTENTNVDFNGGEAYGNFSQEGSGFDLGRIASGKCRSLYSHDNEGKGFTFTGTAYNVQCEGLIAARNHFGAQIYGVGTVSLYNCYLGDLTQESWHSTTGHAIQAGVGAGNNWTLNLKNVILDERLGGDHRALLWNSTAGTIATSDYNCFNGTLRKDSTSYADLAAWQAANSLDEHSVERDPQVDADYTPAVALEEAGTWIAGVTLFDGLPQPLRPPIGAVARRDYPGRRFAVGGASL